ncbi:hypothetical protein CHU95_13515 [Niveispirillum lacus]|uniref:Surface antigen domain-containing protein n=1 Tax=Niveispirillum lacus TaxID=1981099 RepID=A0A255YXK2_9PROT|nr:hypothetical protein [Niveispirillum lacus]OYQ33424.1 hypothetical protein CHU95_13515 [Niveispirillum lacus]
MDEDIMSLRDLGKLAVATAVVLSLVVPPALAGDRGRDGYGHGHHWHDDWGHWRDDRRGYDRGRPGPDYRYKSPPGWYDRGGYAAWHWDAPPPVRRRADRDVVFGRPYRHGYHGYGYYRRDDDAALFLGLTALSLVALGVLTEAQQRAHEDAQIRATMAPVGQPIIWSDGSDGGSVTALREGRTPQGAYCREFQQQVTIGGRTEDAYGTACQQPDGSWQVVP